MSFSSTTRVYSSSVLQNSVYVLNIIITKLLKKYLYIISMSVSPWDDILRSVFSSDVVFGRSFGGSASLSGGISGSASLSGDISGSVSLSDGISRRISSSAQQGN